MATIEDRLQSLEQEQTELKKTHVEIKKTIELQTIAIGALVNKATLEKLNDKYEKLFDTLIEHDRFTNEQLAELRDHQIETDGKVVGLQTQLRQTDKQLPEIDGKVVGLQTQLRQTEKRIDARFEQVDARFERVDARFEQVDARFEQVDIRLGRMETLLTQIIERLPKNG